MSVRAPVQRQGQKSTANEAPQAAPGSARDADVKSQLRGTSFEAGEAMLSPSNEGGLISRSGSGEIASNDPGATFSAATRGGGGAVPYRADMEKSFGRSFGDVQAYTGRSQEMGDLGAEAAAQGKSVAFGTSNPSKELVAHELAHVVQNDRGGSGVQGKSTVSTPSAAAEREADSVASKAAAGERVSVKEAPGAGIQLKGKKGKKGKNKRRQNQTQTQTPPTKEGVFTKLVKTLGQVKDWASFQSIAGSILESMAPSEGDSCQLELKGKLPIYETGVVTVNLGMALQLEVERTPDGIKVKGETGVLIEGAADTSLLGWFRTKGAIGVQVYGNMEAEGSSGAQVMQLFGLGIEETVRGVNGTLADKAFGGDYAEKVVKGMGDKDSVSTTLGAKGYAEARFGSQDPTAEKENVKVEGEGGKSYTTKYGKNTLNPQDPNALTGLTPVQKQKVLDAKARGETSIDLLAVSKEEKWNFKVAAEGEVGGVGIGGELEVQGDEWKVTGAVKVPEGFEDKMAAARAIAAAARTVWLGAMRSSPMTGPTRKGMLRGLAEAGTRTGIEVALQHGLEAYFPKGAPEKNKKGQLEWDDQTGQEMALKVIGGGKTDPFSLENVNLVSVTKTEVHVPGVDAKMENKQKLGGYSK